VAKINLVSRLQSVLHSDEMRIAKNLTETPALVNELQNFRATIYESGFTAFSARQGALDDLVLSLALAVWWLAGPRGSSRMHVQPLEL
jgi:hypothetical protein